MVFSYFLSKRLTNRIRREPQKYRWIPSKVRFDYIKNASDALYPISFRVVRFAVKDGLYETVITNLPADRFPPSAAPCTLPQTLGNRDIFPRLEVHPGIDALSC